MSLQLSMDPTVDISSFGVSNGPHLIITWLNERAWKFSTFTILDGIVCNFDPVLPIRV